MDETDGDSIDLRWGLTAEVEDGRCSFAFSLAILCLLLLLLIQLLLLLCLLFSSAIPDFEPRWSCSAS